MSEPLRCVCACNCFALATAYCAACEAAMKAGGSSHRRKLIDLPGSGVVRVPPSPAAEPPDPGRWLTQDELYEGGLELVTSEDTAPLYGLQVYHDVAQAVESLKAEAEHAGLEMWIYTGDPTKLPAAPPIPTPPGPGLWVYAVPWGPEMVASVKKVLGLVQTLEGAAAVRLPRTLPTPSVSLLDPEYAPSDSPFINTVPGYEKLVNYLSSAVHPHEVPDEMVLAHITPDNILLVTLEVLRSRSTENP